MSGRPVAKTRLCLKKDETRPVVTPCSGIGRKDRRTRCLIDPVSRSMPSVFGCLNFCHGMDSRGRGLVSKPPVDGRNADGQEQRNCRKGDEVTSSCGFSRASTHSSGASLPLDSLCFRHDRQFAVILMKAGENLWYQTHHQPNSSMETGDACEHRRPVN